MIRTELRNDRGEIEQLSIHDPRYWEGPYHYVPYPKALYRATVARGFTDPESRIVNNPDEERRLLNEGWLDSPERAREAKRRIDDRLAQDAAESAYADSLMSERAQAERLAVERASDDHVVDVPAPKTRGRKPKTQTPDAA